MIHGCCWTAGVDVGNWRREADGERRRLYGAIKEALYCAQIFRDFGRCGYCMTHTVHRVMSFDRFAMDLAAACLRAGDTEIELRPKSFAVLRYLVQNPGRLVTKQELLDAVWPDVTVSDEAIAQCIWELRQKLGDRDHRLIKTVARRGYLLGASVSAGPLQPRSDGLHGRAQSSREGSQVPRGVPLMAPDPPRAFIERRDLTTLVKAHLLSGSGGTLALRGAGGFGKTSLANHLC